MRDNLTATGLFLWWALIVFAVIGLATAGYYVALPALVHRETEASRQSYGYVQTKQQHLIRLLGDYDRLQNEDNNLTGTDSRKADLEAQQRADVEQMRAESALLNPADVPSSVAQFLAGASQ